MADGHRLATALALAILLSIGIADRAAAAPDVRPGAKLKRVVEPLPPGKLRQDVLRYVESLRVQGPGTPYGVYRPAPSQAPSLYASCDAALVRYILGDLDLSPLQRRQWIDHINGFQDPKTGKYPAERFLHLFGRTVRALNALGGEPKYPPAFLRRWVDPETAKRWMEGLSWQSPWEPSIQVLHVAAPRGAAAAMDRKGRRREAEWLSGVLDWLDARQDPKTGLWGPDRGASTFDGMGATFHFLPLYEAADRTMPRGRQIVDATLAIQKSKHGTWGGVYADMDAVSLLAYFYVREDYRRDDIQQSLRTSIELLFKTAYDAKTGAFGDLANTVGACEHLAETAAVLKDHPYCGVGWRRAWDWRLWKCRW
jgi:hypothetical protein